MNKDYENIKELFDKDGIKAPDSLSEDNIFAMLPDAEEIPADQTGGTPEEFIPVNARSSKPDRKRFTAVRKYIAIAACALIAIAGAPQLYNAVVGTPDTDLVNGELKTFESYNEIERLIKSMDKDSGGFHLFRMGGGEVVEESTGLDYDDYDAGDMATGVAKDSASNAYGSSAGSDHSETYLQVEEVDEADIVKTDGKYIYYVNDKEEVIILSAENGKTRKLATIGNTGVENYIHDIFLKGDKLVTIGRVYDDDNGSTAIVTYDISDRTKPEVAGEFRQSGDIVSSRMVGDYVYLVTNEYVYDRKHVIPQCTIGGKYTDIPVNDICCVPEPSHISYVILSAVDIASQDASKSKTKAVFGASDTIYCNDHNLYTAVTSWNWNNSGSDGTSTTRILRASLDGLKIRFNATATVRGDVNNQFSMNEKDGYFYVATTSQRDGMDVNNLFVLDKNFKEVGKISGFARNESIRAVRYFGDKAYVITYEQIDPLFIIDLSDPANPRIEGEVKIDGFSSLLIPAGEGRLLGIGYATGDNGYGGEYASGLKLALFDISDPSAPVVLASKEFKDMESPAQYTHLALTVNKKDGWYAIPYSVYTYEDELIEDDVTDDDDPADSEPEEPEEAIDPGLETGVLVFSADEKINVLDRHKLNSEYLNRCVYIGDYIYALDEEGNVSSFRM